VGVDDYEADDVMASYAVTEPGPTKIVTGDRDLFQLVDDKRKIAVVYLAKGITNHDHVDIEWIANKYDIPGERYALFAMIRGDASDGLPGIRGIGEKGAAIIAKQFTTLPEVMAAAKKDDERLTPNARKKLLESAEYAKIAPKLVHCALDVPLPKLDLRMPKRPDSMDEIYQYQKDYGLGASVDRLISALNW
jgi:5'-3' exonuclease